MTGSRKRKRNKSALWGLVCLTGVMMFLALGVAVRAETVVCRVDVGRKLGPVQPGLLGTNLEWFNNANGLWVSPGRLDKRLLNLAMEQGLGSIRFPGGTLSDFYDWRDGTGPRQKRPTRPHHTDPGQSPNSFGTPEFLHFCRVVGAEPLLTVNAGTGTPELAAQWVRYCNDAGDPSRIADGLKDPVPVRYWEIGNELYLNGSEAEKRITTTPKNYADRFLAFAAAMRQVDPTIELMALGVAQSYSIAFGPYPDWTETVLKKAASQIDFVAVHNAYFPLMHQEKNPDPRDVYQAMWAAAQAVDESLAKLEKLIAKYEQDRDIGIAVTEWGPFFSFSDPAWMDHVKTLGSAVYAARILQVFMSHPKVRMANYFKFTDQSFMGWVSYTRQPKVPYHVIKLFRHHFGSRRVKAEIGGPTYNTIKLGLTLPRKNVPELTVTASLNEPGDKLFVNIVSTGWKAHHRVLLETPGFVPEPEAKIWMITGPEVVSNNGPDLPKWWPWPIIEPGPQAVVPIGITESKWNIANPLNVPPHSIMTVELTNRGSP